MNRLMNEIRKKSKGGLEKELFKKSDQLRRLRFDLAGGQLKNVREIRFAKKDIARILTDLKERAK